MLFYAYAFGVGFSVWLVILQNQKKIHYEFLLVIWQYQKSKYIPTLLSSSSSNVIATLRLRDASQYLLDIFVAARQ